VLACSRPPLNSLYPSDGDKVDAVFRRVGMVNSREVLKRLRDPEAAGFRLAAPHHPLFTVPPSRASHVRGMVDRVQAAKFSRSPTSSASFLASIGADGAVGSSIAMGSSDSDKAEGRNYSTYSIPPERLPGGRAVGLGGTVLSVPIGSPGPLTDLAALAASDIENWRYNQIMQSTGAGAGAAPHGRSAAASAAALEPTQPHAPLLSSSATSAFEPVGGGGALTNKQFLNMQQQMAVAQQLESLKSHQAAVSAAAAALQAQRLGLVSEEQLAASRQPHRLQQQHQQQQQQHQQQQQVPSPQQQLYQEASDLTRLVESEKLALAKDLRGGAPPSHSTYRSILESQKAGNWGVKAAESLAGGLALSSSVAGAPQGSSGNPVSATMPLSHMGRPPLAADQLEQAYSRQQQQHGGMGGRATSGPDAAQQQQYYFIDPVRLGSGKVQLGAMGIDGLRAQQALFYPHRGGGGAQGGGGGGQLESWGAEGGQQVGVGENLIAAPFRSPPPRVKHQLPKVFSGPHK
jgi:hypothetical protein